MIASVAVGKPRSGAASSASNKNEEGLLVALLCIRNSYIFTSEWYLNYCFTLSIVRTLLVVGALLADIVVVVVIVIVGFIVGFAGVLAEKVIVDALLAK